MKNKFKKFLIRIILIMIILSTLLVVKVNAVTTRVGIECASEGNPDHRSGVYYNTTKNTYKYRLVEMQTLHDVFCIEKGQDAYEYTGPKNIKVPGCGTYNIDDITGSTIELTGTPTSSGPFSARTSPEYRVAEHVENGPPRESYILAEMIASKDGTTGRVTTNFKIDAVGALVAFLDPDDVYDRFTGTVESILGTNIADIIEIVGSDGKFHYYMVDYETSYMIVGTEVKFATEFEVDEYGIRSYVQDALWLTPTAEILPTTTAPSENDLYTEAKEFEKYILKAAGVTSRSQLTYQAYNGTRTYVSSAQGYSDVNVQGLNVPVINYEPKFIKKGTTVAFNDVDQTYKIGPFQLEYFESIVNTSGINLTLAGISGVQMETNIKDEVLILYDPITNPKYYFKFIYNNNTKINPDTLYPSSGEEFYIEIPYYEELEEIRNINFSFNYMIAGSEYYKLSGEDGCEISSWSLEQNTSTGKYYLEKSYSTKIDIQNFLYGFKAARWYEGTELNTNSVITLKRGNLSITKELVKSSNTAQNEVLNVDSDYVFEVKVITSVGTSTQDVVVTVPAGQSTGTKVISTEQWGFDIDKTGGGKITLETPKFEITEKDQTNFVSYTGNTPMTISNYSPSDSRKKISGDFQDKMTVNITAKNKVGTVEHKGNVRISKKVTDPTLNGDYYFILKINGEEKETITVASGSSVESSYITWKEGEDAPKYEVIEVVDLTSKQPVNEANLKYRCLGTNMTGELVDTKTVDVIATNTTDISEGTLKIKKDLVDSLGNAITGVPFKFEVAVDGFETRIVEIKSGETWTSTFNWVGTAPRYSVEEFQDERFTAADARYKFNGYSVNGGSLVTTNSVSGTLRENKIEDIIAYNEEKIQTNEGSLKIIKNIKNSDGTAHVVLSGESASFEYEVEVTYANGEKEYIPINIEFSAGKSEEESEEITVQWKDGEDAPKYKVTEKFNDKYTPENNIYEKTGEFEAGTLKEENFINIVNDKIGKIQFTKKIVDKDGNSKALTKGDKTFKFSITIIYANGMQENKIETITVSNGTSEKTSGEIEATWSGDTPPVYVITEYKEPNSEDKTKKLEGNFENGLTKNLGNYENIVDENEHIGYVKIQKNIVDESGAPKPGTFNFDILITNSDGTKYSIEKSINISIGDKQKATDVIEIKWYGAEAPTYKITEKMNNEDYKLVSSVNESGILKENTSSEPIVAEFSNVSSTLPYNGVLKIEKKLEQIVDIGQPVEFKFKVRVYSDEQEYETIKTITVSNGENYKEIEVGTFCWEDENKPLSYDVEEIEIPAGYELQGIYNNKGKLKSTTPTETVVRAVNKIKTIGERGNLQIQKQVVDANGKPVAVLEDTTFYFNVEIGSETLSKIPVTVKKGETTGVSDKITRAWVGETKPTYKVTEQNKYSVNVTDIEMLDGTGTREANSDFEPINKEAIGEFSGNDATVTAVCSNKCVKKIKHGAIKIVKELIKTKNFTTTDTEKVPLTEDKEFWFDVQISGETRKVKVKVDKETSTGESEVISVDWDETAGAPTYTITELETEDNWEITTPAYTSVPFQETEDSNAIPITFTNKAKINMGTVIVDKKLIGSTSTNSFEIEIFINGISQGTKNISAGGTQTISDIKWYSYEEPPVVMVKETGIPNGFTCLGYINNDARLMNNEDTKITVQNAGTGSEQDSGYIQIHKTTKAKDGTIVDANKDFTFKITVDGKEEYVTMKGGETVRSSTYYWEKGGTRPRYTVEEISDPKYDSTISNSTGTLNAGEPIYIEAENVLKGNKKQGTIQIEKVVKSEDKGRFTANETFKFKITISSNDYFEYDGKLYTGSYTIYKNILVNGEKGISDKIGIKWYGEDPTVIVEEYDISNDWKKTPEWKIKTGSTIEEKNSGKLTDRKDTLVTCTNIENIERVILLTMEMGGLVWDDKNVDGIWYDGANPSEIELGIENIKVVVWKKFYKDSTCLGQKVAMYLDEENNEAKEGILYTDETGAWKINKIKFPGVSETEKEEIRLATGGNIPNRAKYDIEFYYDGQTYMPTKFAGGIDLSDTTSYNKFVQEYKGDNQRKEDDGTSACTASRYATSRGTYNKLSIAKEDESIRKSFDEKFSEIQGESPIDGNMKTIGKTDTSISLFYDGEERIDGDVSKIESKLVLTDEEGNIKNEFLTSASTSNAGLLYPLDNRTVLTKTDTVINAGVRKVTYFYHAAYPYLNSINLGLTKRPDADLSIRKDLVEASVVVNKNLLNYEFGKIRSNTSDNYWGEASNEDMLSKQIAYLANNIQYQLKLYTADYLYRSSMYLGTEAGDALEEYFRNIVGTGLDELDLDVYLKYAIKVTNNGDTAYYANVNQISDYFDKSLTLVTTKESKYIDTVNGEYTENPSGSITVAEPSSFFNSSGVEETITWDEASCQSSEYNRIVTDDLKGENIESGESREIFVTFKVNKKFNLVDLGTGVREAIDNGIELGKKDNIVEIDSYTTKYNFDDASRGIHKDNIAGKIDRNSAPNNINIQEFAKGNSYFEDDTERAPVLELSLQDNKREIDGKVWLDEDDHNVEFSEHIGNGIMKNPDADKTETKIRDMTTELWEKVNVAGRDYDFLIPTDKPMSFLGGRTYEQTTSLDTTIRTSNTTGQVGKYNFEGIPTGNYVVRFTYGDEFTRQYNGQQYKSTTYQVGYPDTDTDGRNDNINGDGLISNKWHDLNYNPTDRDNDARDNEYQRLELIKNSQDLTYDNTSKIDYITKLKDDGSDFAKTSQQLIEELDVDLLEKYSIMTADTAKIKMDIEDSIRNTIEALKGEVKANVASIEVGTPNPTTINNVDFGLEKRSTTNMTLDKQIEEIKLTTSSGDVILDAKWDIGYNFNILDDGTAEFKAIKNLLPGSIGKNNLQALDNNADIQGYRYINIDEDILQGATINITYRFTALNLGEVDRYNKDWDEKVTDEVLYTAKEENTQNYTFGKYLGKVYYQGATQNADYNWDDNIVKTKVRQLVDYVDNDVVFSQMENTNDNTSWTNTTTLELLNDNLIDNNITVSEGTDFEIIDDRDPNAGRAYEQGTNNLIVSVDSYTNTGNLGNPELVKDTIPYAGSYDAGGKHNQAYINLSTSRYYSAEDDTENIDNITEIIKMYNTVGRRDDMAIHGNYNPALGYTGLYEAGLLKEHDASATEVITLSPPTGIQQQLMMAIQIIAVTLSAIAILAIGIVIIKRKVLIK